MNIAVLVNAGAGSIGRERCEARRDEILAACDAVGVEARVWLCEPAQLADHARTLARAGQHDAVVAAGGDGTVSTIAGALAGTPMPLAVIPLGTLNHFAKDLGLPVDDITAAIRAIAAQHTRHVDVAELNGRVFINNSSIGLYPEVVLRRDVDRKQTGRGKWGAMLRAGIRVLRLFPLLEVAIVTGDRMVVTRTPFVFVGNNRYSLALGALGERPALDRGQLSLVLVRSTSRLHMLWTMLRAIVQRASAVNDLEAHDLTETRVVTRRRVVRVALDGEVALMRPPLRYRTRPAALRVLAPPPVAATEPVRAPGDTPTRSAG